MNKLTIEKDSNSLSNFTIKSNQNNSILISTLLDSLLFLSILYGLFKGVSLSPSLPTSYAVADQFK